jgi:hypothetical protein
VFGYSGSEIISAISAVFSKCEIVSVSESEHAPATRNRKATHAKRLPELMNPPSNRSAISGVE